jgi:ABC-type methionine transport system ATPase subunit
VSVLIASHYAFYLKFKNAYLTLEKDPRNKILSDYKSLRRLFITKIFIIWISAFIIIFIELILFGIVITISRIYIEEIEKLKLVVKNEKKYDEADRANQIKNFEVKEELKLKLNNDKTTEVLFEDNIKFFLNSEGKRNKPNRAINLPSERKPLNPSVKLNPYRRDNEGKVSAMNIKGKIELRHVYFAYPTRPQNVILKDVSLVINPGEQTAFVGYSGSGKSTIIQLLTRFYDVEEGKGEVLIDDVNIKDYNLYELRKKIGLVSQEPTLFRVSVLENVRYGRLDATDDECIEAAREANIMKFFTKDRMNEVIGENKKSEGVGEKKDPVSGGEKQRLAIARAFLKNPTILLLDEATSALDKDSELEVQKSLDKLSANRTSVSIAHRLSTVEGCDKIFVLENGRLVEQGTHEELMKLGRKYYTLHKYSDSG